MDAFPGARCASPGLFSVRPYGKKSRGRSKSRQSEPVLSTKTFMRLPWPTAPYSVPNLALLIYTFLMQRRTAARVSLTALLGTPVTDAQGHLRGRLKDIAVATGA